MMRKSTVLLVVVLAVLMVGAGVAFMQRARRVGTPVAGANGPVIQLAAGENLQRALDQAKPGDTIVLEAGAVYKGPFTLPVKQGNEFITIQSSKISELPEGVRVNPRTQSALFAKLQSAENGSPIIKTAPGAHHYKFIGVEISTANAQVKVHDLVRLGDGTAQKRLDAVPHHLVIDRSYIHGFETQEVQRGISLNSAETSITNSHISDVHGKGYDTQAICGWNGPGPFKIINNYLEGAGENVMFGGADPSIPNLVPSDIEIRDNYFFKPLSWKEGDPSYGGHHWSVKNLFELKNARRVTIDRNIFENNWVDAQAGAGILFTVRNDEGTAPWSTIEDVTFTNNIVKNSPAALNLLGKDNLKPSQRAKNIVISNNFFTGIKATFLTMSGYHNVTISNNTHIQSGNIMSLYGDPSPGFVYKNNITVRDPKGYGVKGASTGEGTIALGIFTPGAEFVNNVIVGANASQYPGNNSYPSSLDEVGFAAAEAGDYRLGPRSRYRQTGSQKAAVGCDFDLLPKPSK
ncbi:MAG TPA: right-handed parallel beta-helix repeat-containing protein [Pyrinomonadaceae bacterium]|nr:right-handed parallel beta-helix repeat-containing protein [Pyrinomonadaceae bacterium]